ncbi:TPA: ATP-dependent DNA helicase RecQ [Vibrio parahaemolyticus]|nr:ATP-dependent DNA helicase RecQ [Vibrio parahaemolyticus]
MNRLPINLLTSVAQQLAFFPNNQFTDRLGGLLQSQNVVLEDFLLLLRDCLMAAKLSGHNVSVHLKTDLLLDIRSTVGKFGLVYDVGLNSIKLNSAEYSKDVLDAYKTQKRNRTSRLKIDPALAKRLGDPTFQYYKNRTQQQAVRTVLTCQEDATVVVGIPTGSGKTLVAHASILFSQPGQLSVVVMPTIGLAMEQAERFKKVLVLADNGQVVKDYAWHSGLDKSDKRTIQSNIEAGTQKALFVSPEAVTKSLLRQLFGLAKNGKLGNFIIDEAHLIDSWGSQFRPDFQRLSALVSSLRRISSAPLKLLFMSATFTDRNLATIRSLFCEDTKSPVIVNGSFLRPEMSINRTVVDQEQHFEVVRDRVMAFPKPMIIYGTTIKDTEKLRQVLVDIGITRYAVFTGQTDVKDKDIIIEQWQNNELDIVVATSAFGVGMDKQDVRSVLHGAVPENIDRYYQEIGRSGRDGCASVCDIIYHSEQIEAAEKINEGKLIGIDNGSRRWQRMWDDKTVTENEATLGGDDHCYTVDTTLYNIDNLNKKTDANTDWNWLTLLLMQRSGLIRLYYPEPNVSKLEQTDDKDDFWSDYFNKVIVEVKDEAHLEQQVWLDKVEQQRRLEKAAQKRGLSDLLKWLRGESSVCQVLSEYYVLNKRSPVKTCGGCPECRQAGKVVTQVMLGDLVQVDGYLYKHFNEQPVFVMGYFSTQFIPTSNELQKVFYRLLVTKQVVALCSDSSTIDEVSRSLPAGYSGFWVALELNEQEFQYPTFVVDTRKKGITELPFLPVDNVYFLASDALQDEEHAYRRWYESKNTVMNFSNFKHYVETLNVNN